MKQLDHYQIYLCAFLMIGMLFGMHYDIFNLTEGCLGFAFGLLGFIHAGIKLILEA